MALSRRIWDAYTNAQVTGLHDVHKLRLFTESLRNERLEENPLPLLNVYDLLLRNTPASRMPSDEDLSKTLSNEAIANLKTRDDETGMALAKMERALGDGVAPMQSFEIQTKCTGKLKIETADDWYAAAAKVLRCGLLPPAPTGKHESPSCTLILLLVMLLVLIGMSLGATQLRRAKPAQVGRPAVAAAELTPAPN